jgi:hypothetical protein
VTAEGATEEPERFSKEHRRQERARIARLNRLPGPFQAYADRGRRQVLVVHALQATLVVGLTLLLCKAVTGDWFPRYVAIVALAVSVVLTAVNRSVNARSST